MVNKEITEIVNYGYPDYQGLPKVEKRVLLLPLVEQIREFYKDPENRRKFETWKANREIEKLKSTA